MCKFDYLCKKIIIFYYTIVTAKTQNQKLSRYDFFREKSFVENISIHVPQDHLKAMKSKLNNKIKFTWQKS